MINRSARLYEEPMIPVSHQQSARKFGNIVNRNDKLDKPPRLFKAETFGKTNDTENARPQYYNNQNYNISEYEAQKKYIVSTLQPPAYSQSVSEIGNDTVKKDKQNRNREFVAKVENINKIHEQISSLLKYVKNGQSKSLVKSKQIPQQRSKTIDGIQKMIKQRMKADNTNRTIIEQKYEQSLISPVTQDQRNYLKQFNYPQRQLQKKQIQKIRDELSGRLMNNYLNPSPAKSTQNEYKRGQKIMIEQNKTLDSPLRNYKESMKSNQQFKDLHNQTKKFLQSRNQHHLIKYSDVEEKAQSRQLSNNKRQKFSYNFDSNEDPSLILKEKASIKNKFDKKEKSFIDYDYEISKVKQRIQNSEQMTKKMQQKYLAPHHAYKNAAETRGNLNATCYKDQQLKYFRAKQEPKSSKLLTDRSRFDEKQEKSQTFQLKLYPCSQRTLGTQKMNKQEVSKAIAERLSDQIKLDQKLRDARQLFHDCKVPEKWKSLQLKLKDLGLSYSQTQLENQLSISPNQSNPFILDGNGGTNAVHLMAQAFAKSEQYWQKNFTHFLSRKTISNSGFQVREMDLDQRGYLTVEDLVCFVNLHSNNFFRNRDIIYLFRRIMALGKSRNGVEYNCFLDIISTE